MPICLPQSDRFPDTRGVVHVAGWGALQVDLKICSYFLAFFNKTWNLWAFFRSLCALHLSPDQIHLLSANFPSPIYQFQTMVVQKFHLHQALTKYASNWKRFKLNLKVLDKLKKLYFSSQEQNLSVFPPKSFTQVNVYNEKGKLLTECFRPESTREGWCGTCQVINISKT